MQIGYVNTEYVVRNDYDAQSPSAIEWLQRLTVFILIYHVDILHDHVNIYTACTA